MTLSIIKKLISQDEEQKIMIHDIKSISAGYMICSNIMITIRRSNILKGIYESGELKEKIRFSDDHMVKNVILNRYVGRFIDAGIHYDFDVRRARMDYMQVDDLNLSFCVIC